MLRNLLVYEAAVAATAHATDPRVFDAVWFSTTAGAASCTIVPALGTSVALAGIPTGTVIPIRTLLITALTGTNVACVGLRSPVMASWFNSAAAVTPDDTVANIFDGFWVSAIGGGTRLDITPAQGPSAVTFTVAAGQFVPVRSRLVPAATTATVVGLRF